MDVNCWFQLFGLPGWLACLLGQPDRLVPGVTPIQAHEFNRHQPLPGAACALDAVLVPGRCSGVLLVLESTLDDFGLAAGALNPLDVFVIRSPHPPRQGIGVSRTWAWCKR